MHFCLPHLNHFIYPHMCHHVFFYVRSKLNFISPYKYMSLFYIPFYNIDRNCDVLPIVEYSIETDDGQTLN
jgi:hypothetical protein